MLWRDNRGENPAAEEKDKEDDGNGKMVIKGSREFIEEMTARLNQRKYTTTTANKTNEGQATA